MRAVVTALTAVLVLGGCGGEGKQEAPPASQSDAPQFVTWASLNQDQVIVGEGVTYSLADGAGRIVGVPMNAGAGGSTGGVGVRLPDSVEQEASGAHVRVTVRASSADDGALLGVAYSTADVGNSGWQAFVLTPASADYSFDYAVPAIQAGNGDFIGFRSYEDDSVMVYGYRVEVIGPSSATRTTQ